MSARESMRLGRFMTSEGPRYALVENDEAVELRQSPFTGPIEPSAVRHRLSDVDLLAPCTPSKIVLASGNYMEVIRTHGKQVPKEPVVFLKPSTAVLDPGGSIRWPRGVEELTLEPELAVVLARRCHDISPAEVDDHLLGYTCLNDVSAWDVLAREVQFTRSKGYDTFAPIGPHIVSGDIDAGALGIRAFVNGRKALETTTADMVFPVAELVSFVSRYMTLLPGDVISTGASGVAPMEVGDRVEIDIDGVGRLVNDVVGPGTGAQP